MANDQTPAPGDDQRFKDESTHKRNHEMLSNEKDEITEADISNIRTDVAPTEPVDTPRNIDPSDPKSAEHKIKDDTNPSIGNDSWNVLEGDN